MHNKKTLVLAGNTNHFLNFLKGIACIFVVFMHAEFPGYLGVVVQTISRFCVPLFFMISGYYSFYDDSTKRIGLRKAIHILKIITFASLIYLIIYLVKSIHSSDWGSYSLRMFVEFVVFNEPHIISGHLWFLFALLYVYLIYWFVEKFNLQKVLYIFIPFLFCSYIVLAQGLSLMGYNLPTFYYRNFLIEGLLFFAIGHFIHCYKNIIRINNFLLLVVFLVFTGLCILERKLLGRDFGVNFSTFPQVISLFILSLQNPKLFEKTPLTKIGKRYSLFVYILHPAIWMVLIKIYSAIGISNNTLANYLMPVFVVLFTLLISIGIVLLLELIKFLISYKKVTNNGE